jgi:hypothetical protein
MKMKKYSPFMNIDTFKYKKILKEVVLGRWVFSIQSLFKKN